LHRTFCERLPEELLRIDKERVNPGELRRRDVAVGIHVAPHAENLPAFLVRFEEAYPASLPALERIVAVAAAHHRILWIHPFLDGNGRVARLMSHAAFRRLGAGGPWSVARGLARRAGDYKARLAAADNRRHHDTDGRGTLSEAALVDFCRFFLEVSIDQIDYMTSLLRPTELLNRMQVHVAEEVAARRMPKGTFGLLREALLGGPFDRGRAAALTGYGERSARKVVGELVERKLLLSDGPKKPVRLGFPIGVIERWFPLLYPSL
jgi:Fic family protein